MRKLKSTFVMILILSLLLFSAVIRIVITGINKKEEVVEENVEDIVVIPETFVGKVINDINVPDEIVDLIINYNDDYYMSIYTLDQVYTAQYFMSDINGAVSDSAIKLLVEIRKLYDFDFSLLGARYDITFTDYYRIEDTIYVDFLIDDSMEFAFLNGISSKTYDIENSMSLRKVDDEYKIVDYDKVQGYYMMFHDNEFNSLSDVDDVYNFYFKQLKNSIENENYLKQNNDSVPYLASKTYDVVYDRKVAAEYANKYYHLRNDDWYDFSNEGGNCQNFASQCLLAGGMLMDYEDDDYWYYDSPEVDYRSASWVSVPYFYDYCLNNESSGLVVDCDVDMCYAEVGDIVQVGISYVSHSTIVSDIVDGHILLNSNSLDMCNWPLEAYTYPTRVLIKILGSNY